MQLSPFIHNQPSPDWKSFCISDAGKEEETR